jgi:hypothetical protein
MFKDICGGGGKGDSGSSYDPQIGKAAKQGAEVAAKAQAFSEKYYTEVITPLLQQQNTASLDSQAKLGKLYDINAEQMGLAVDRYKQYGIPAEERYYNMVDKYSEPEEMERQAELAKGDFGTAQAGQQAAMARRMSALGIDPTSPGAVSAMGDMAIQGAAVQASAMNRARNAARSLGMQLTSDAANFGRGGQSGILQFGAGAQGNATGAFGMANQALATGSQAGNMVLQGYDTAARSYNNIMDSYAKLGSADIQANASSGSDMMGGLGQLGGTLLSTGLKSGWMMCDIRTKENLRVVGTLPNGVVVYRYNYKPEYSERWGSGDQVGVVAQQVQEVMPEAVRVDSFGYLNVNYDRLK